MAVSQGHPREALTLVEPFFEGQPLDDRERALLFIARGNARSDLDDFRGSLDDLEDARRVYAEAGRPGRPARSTWRSASR